MKESNEKKLEALKNFLLENNIKIRCNHKSNTFGIVIPLKVRRLRIAVFLSDGNHEYEQAIHDTPSPYNGRPLCSLYKPFFIRNEESLDFVLEKMQNCIVSRMLLMQKKWQKKQRKQVK